MSKDRINTMEKINLNNKYCIFTNKKSSAKRFFLLKGEDEWNEGVIKDINSKGHNNERFWEAGEDWIKLYSINHTETSLFTLDKSRTEKYNYEYLFFEGKSKGDVPLEIIAVKSRSDLWLDKTKFKNYDYIKRNQLEVGEHTYGSIRIHDPGYGKLVIGDYCSIGSSCRFIIGNHRTDLISTYPFSTLSSYFSDNKVDIKDHNSKNGGIIIGNDVWIGNSAQIMSGVCVGDGAIIAANAIVTKNVPPYAIVGGNPAKIIRYRFPEDVREKLIKIAWWNWPEEIVAERLNDIVSDDILAFIKKYEGTLP